MEACSEKCRRITQPQSSMISKPTKPSSRSLPPSLFFSLALCIECNYLHTPRTTHTQTQTQASKQTNKQANKQTSKLANKQTSKQSNNQTIKHSNNQSNKQTIKQSHTRTHTHIYIYIHTVYTVCTVSTYICHMMSYAHAFGILWMMFFFMFFVGHFHALYVGLRAWQAQILASLSNLSGGAPGRLSNGNSVG